MTTGKLISTGIVSAIAASLCCITPVLALIAGSGSVASSFSWLAPARPYMIGVTLAALGFAWYQKLWPRRSDECACSGSERPPFFRSKTFLLIVTIFAAVMIAFPSYAKIFFPKTQKTVIVTGETNIQTVKLSIRGMGCKACEAEVNHEVNRLPGIIQSTVSYERKEAIIQFDRSKVNAAEIVNAVQVTGYKVIGHSLSN
jgi:copper chaperone CopZ